MPSHFSIVSQLAVITSASEIGRFNVSDSEYSLVTLLDIWVPFMLHSNSVTFSSVEFNSIKKHSAVT